MDSVSDPEVPFSFNGDHLSPILLNHPSLVPLQSAGRVTLVGSFRVSPGWPRLMDTSMFIVGDGDVQSSCMLFLSPVGICVQLGCLVSHEQDFSLFQTSFVALGDIESCAQPPFLVVPHSLNLPITRLPWQSRMTCWCRSRLRDISCLPMHITVFEEVEEVSEYSVAVQEIPGTGKHEFRCREVLRT